MHVAGAGAAGLAVARALHERGWPIGLLACRTKARAAERVALLGAGTPTDLATLAAAPPAERAAPAGAVLLVVAVPDRAIASCAETLACRRWPDGSVALHLSGSVEVEALAPLRAAGCAVGGFHPLKSFVDGDRAGQPLRDVVVALEGDPAALALAERAAADVGARPFRLRPRSRAAWHAAAAHAANHLVALVDQSLDLMERAGLPRDRAREALVPLLRSSVDNLARAQPAAALTGPVVRGDAEVVARHLGALADASPDVRRAYVALAARALALARRRGLSEDLAEAVARLLEGA